MQISACPLCGYKAKRGIEVLEGEKTLNEIASKHELLPKNLQNWKKQFLENASLAFDKSYRLFLIYFAILFEL